MSPTYGKLVGHWCISKEVIGSGTTSTVHLAYHSSIPTLHAAVKIVSRKGLLLKAEGDPTALHLADDVIHREVLLMKLASHERIVKLYESVQHGDLVYMFLEHAPNQTLFDLFRTHSSFLPTPLVTHLFSHLIHAVAHLHSLHIVHRDIKLENVFLFGPDVKDVLQSNSTKACSHKYKHFLHNAKYTPTHARIVPSPSYTDLTLKLGDFGLSHAHSPTVLSTVFHGSPHYQAPELWARVPHHVFPTDVWSAGVVLFALVGRRLPFEVRELEQWGHIFNEGNYDEPLAENNNAHAREKNLKKERDVPPIPRAGSPLHMPYDPQDIIPPAIDHLLQRLFALDPAMRPTAQEVLADALFSGTDCASSRADVSMLGGSKDGAGRQPAAFLHARANTYDPHDLYDLATLCNPPTTHVPRATFRESSLERRVRRRLECEEECIEKVWADRLRGWATREGEVGIEADDNENERKKRVEKERKLGWGEKTGWRRSLGRIGGVNVRGHLASLGHLGYAGSGGKAEKAAAQPEHEGHEESNTSVLKPKIGASLSLRRLRIKALHKLFETDDSQSAVYTPSPQASAELTHNDATSTLQILPSHPKFTLPFRTLRVKTTDSEHTHSAVFPLQPLPPTSTYPNLPSSVAPALAIRHDVPAIQRDEGASAFQNRHNTILRRAYELGFRMQDLRVFADEARRTVRDVKGGTKGSGVDKVHGGEGGAITPTDKTLSMAMTLVPENGMGEQKGGVSADVPVVNVVAVEVGHPERGLNVDGCHFQCGFSDGSTLEVMY